MPDHMASEKKIIFRTLLERLPNSLFQDYPNSPIQDYSNSPFQDYHSPSQDSPRKNTNSPFQDYPQQSFIGLTQQSFLGLPHPRENPTTNPSLSHMVHRKPQILSTPPWKPIRTSNIQSCIINILHLSLPNRPVCDKMYVKPWNCKPYNMCSQH